MIQSNKSVMSGILKFVIANKRVYPQLQEIHSKNINYEW